MGSIKVNKHPNSLKNLDRTGVKLSDITKQKMSEANSKYSELEAILNGKIKDRSKWRTFRIYILERDNYICKYCGGKANEIHHIKKKKDFPELCFIESNIVSVCRVCHCKIEPNKKGKV